jgi:predicted transcriptional regulator
MTTRVVTAHIPKVLAEKLDGLAERLDRPRGWLVKEALTHYIGLEDERRRQTHEALAEVDSGKTVEHTDVEAWAAQLGIAKPKRRRG